MAMATRIGDAAPDRARFLPHPGCKTPMIRIEVTLNADPTAISPVVEGIMEMARRLECAAGKEFEIETALREALANAIVHGCKNDPSKRCSVAWPAMMSAEC